MITYERLKELVTYNPITGLFKNNCRRKMSTEGKIIGIKQKDGYIKIWIDGLSYSSHRLAYLYVKRVHPPNGFDIHHKNEIRDDNRWKNLKLLSKIKHRRTFRRKNPPSGVEGVTWRKNRESWIVRIPVHGEMTYIGSSKDFNIAVDIRYKAELKQNYYGNSTAGSAYKYLKERNI